MQAYHTLTRFCPDGSTRPTLKNNDNIFRAQWLTPDKHVVRAIWSPYQNMTYTYKIPSKATVYNHLGEIVHCTDNKLVLPMQLFLLSNKVLSHVLESDNFVIFEI